VNEASDVQMALMRN